MQFMNKQEAEALAARIQREAPDVVIEEIFPATDLVSNRDQYPAGSYLVSIVKVLSDGKSQDWIQSAEHWEAVK